MRLRTSLLSRAAFMLAVGLGFGLAAAPRVHAVTGSAAILPQILPPADTNLTQDEPFNLGITLINQSIDDNLAPIPATLKAGSKIIVTLACGDATCAAPLPGTLAFVPQSAAGCVSKLPQITSCTALGDNQVVLTVGSNLVMAPNAFIQLAQINLNPDEPVITEDGKFTLLANTENITDIQTCSLINPSKCANAAAAGSTIMYFPPPDIGRPCSHICDSRIMFSDGTDPDRFAGSLLLDAPANCNPTTAPLRFRITNADGQVVNKKIPEGSLVKHGSYWLYQNPAAKIAGGIGYVKVRQRKEAPFGWRVDLRVFGDMDSATLAKMTTSLRMCDYVAATTDDWSPLPDGGGWRVDLGAAQ